jgi:putative addiction module killer protein
MGYTLGMKIRQREIEDYQTEDEAFPFRVWFDGLKDKTAKVAIEKRLARMEAGLFGDCKAVVRDEVFEARILQGPGYRLYFAIYEDAIIILLLGGDKSIQTEDIKKAEEYWNDFQTRQID